MRRSTGPPKSNARRPARPGHRPPKCMLNTPPPATRCPPSIPAGPDNPMGLYALYIGRLYAIHGTNANFGIGLRVSHGCVRLRNDDIKFLFENVPVGTRVQFIDEPVKATTEPDGSRYIEVHNPLSTTEAQFQGGVIGADHPDSAGAGSYQPV
ncbi:L,D-transpeptidase family protein [Klebsiella pneumoniae]